MTVMYTGVHPGTLTAGAMRGIDAGLDGVWHTAANGRPECPRGAKVRERVARAG